MTDTEIIEAMTPAEAEELRRTRYSKPFVWEAATTEVIDLSTVERGRPTLDYTQHKAMLVANWKANKETTDEARLVQWVTISDPDDITQSEKAVGAFKSQMGTASKQLLSRAGKPYIGITWVKDVPLPDGRINVGFVAGKRLEGRGRKPRGSVGENAEALGRQDERAGR